MNLTTDKPTFELHGLYGLTLASRFAFANRLSTGSGMPDLRFSQVGQPPVDIVWQEHAAAYASGEQIDDGVYLLMLYQLPEVEVVRFAGMADYYLTSEEIVCHLLDADYDYAVEIWLLGTILAYWLERFRGIPALHAAASVVDGRAVGFLSTNKGGKSSLAATLMQLGHPLLSDDILPLERTEAGFVGRPGYPQMRMWPHQAEHFLGYSQALEKVHPYLDKRRVPVGEGTFGTFCSEAKPLAALYLPHRGDVERVIVEPLSLGEAIMELIRHSFLVELVEAAGLEKQRFAFFAELAKRVPVKRLRYPEGLELLPQVCEALIDDVALTA